MFVFELIITSKIEILYPRERFRFFLISSILWKKCLITTPMKCSGGPARETVISWSHQSRFRYHIDLKLGVSLFVSSPSERSPFAPQHPLSKPLYSVYFDNYATGTPECSIVSIYFLNEKCFVLIWKRKESFYYKFARKLSNFLKTVWRI